MATLSCHGPVWLSFPPCWTRPLTRAPSGELGYHSDTAINIQFSSQLDIRRRAQLSRQASQDGEDDELDSDSDGDRHQNNGATPRHRRGRHHGSQDSDVDMHSVHYHDTQDDEGESEYEAPIDRKRKRKDGVVVLTSSRKMKDSISKKTNPLNSSAAASAAPSSAPTPTDSTEPLGLRRPRQGRNGGKRLRTDMGPVADQTASPLTPAESTSVVSAVLEFPCPYVSPEGRPCAKTFPRWTDYEKHYETMHTGDSGYPWVQKIEAKDCPFRCPHPIPSASRPKTNKGRVVKTVEYGPCDFVTRKNTHDFERHWKGNHIRSEALFIARGNMLIEEARYVNVRDKYDIAYALCPRCPRCEENFTRTDALTRHLRSPCAGGSVGAAVDETNSLLIEGPNKLGRPPAQTPSAPAAASSSSSALNPPLHPSLVHPPSTTQPPVSNNNVNYYRQAAPQPQSQGLGTPEA